MSSDKRTALVTGAAGGIGGAICEALLGAGWQVVAVDRVPPARVHAQLRAEAIDLADGQALAAAAGHWRAVDAFVHAAGTLHTGALGALDHDAGERMWRVHVHAAVRLADALAPAMAARGFGRIVLLGSRVAQGMPGRSQYAACKAALVALARSWAAELVARGVTVNVVSPAATRTPMLDDPARASSAARVPPIGRYIEPREVAALVTYLLGDDAGAITGQELAICGGASLPR